MKKVVIVFGLAVVVGIAAWGLATQKTTPSGGIKIGVIAPLSGQYAFLGESERNAMLLSQKALQAKGQAVQLIFEDDKYDPKVGVLAYEKLKSINQVDAVVAVSAPVIGALKPIVAQDHTLLFSLGESLYHEDDTVFQLMPASDKIAPRLGEEASKRFNRIAIVYSQSGSLWQQWKDDFLKGVDKNDMVETFALPPGSDFRTETQKILAFKPDATTVFLPLEEGIKYLQDLKLYDPKHTVAIICDGNLEFSIGEYTAKVGKDIFEGCISSTLPDTKTSEFVSTYKSTYKAEPVLTADYAYDAVSILAMLAQKNKNDWLSALKNNFKFSGASGEVKFNAVGTRLPEVVIHQYKDGKFVEI